MTSPVTSGIYGTDLDRLYLKTLVSRTALILNSPELSDVKFRFKNVSSTDGTNGHSQGQGTETIVYGHKLILALASPVFYKMFYMEKQNEQFVTSVNNEIEIYMDDPGFSPESFLKFLRFLYTDEICYEDLEFEDIVGILSCADYYDVPCLKKDCAEELRRMIRNENVFRVMDIAETYLEGHLAHKALEFIDRNLGSVVESEEILGIKLETLFKILRRDSLNIDESIVLDLALKWAGKECERKDLKPTGENKREVLGKVFFEIRFGLLTSDRISELVSSNLLSAMESLDVVLDVYTPGYVTTADNSGAKRRKLAPEVGFKSNPRIFGRKKKLLEDGEMEAKWKERNNYDNLKTLAMSLVDGRADLFMGGFPPNKTEDELRNEIQRARPVFDLKVETCDPCESGSGNDEFHVRFKYNSEDYRHGLLLNPAWYKFDNPDSIRIYGMG